MTTIIYAVGTKHGHGTSEGGLVYGTVTKEEIGNSSGYEIKDRSGKMIHVDNDAIDALIAALVEARGPKVLGLPIVL